MRPRTLSEIVGQRAAVGPDAPLARAIAEDRLPSLLLWGPPGCGKTTIANVIANATRAHFEPLSAVLAGVKELRVIVDQAAERRSLELRRTVLFVDEVHRWNRAQQDALLPHVESGAIVLVGATTENPSFALRSALLSRCLVVRLEPLGGTCLEELLRRALADEERGLGRAGALVDDEALREIAAGADGDARRALGVLEIAVELADPTTRCVDLEAVRRVQSGQARVRYDQTGEEHYNVVSAFIKSMRGSDPDAAVYWLVRMLEGGEDPAFILRRILIFASEDVGNADPNALPLAVAADAAFQRVGLPEGVLALTQIVTYLACAPKSNAALVTYGAARKDVVAHGTLAVPAKLRSAPTRAMKDWGYGEGYRYPHDFDGSYVPERYLPDELAGRRYYAPKGAGAERAILERLALLRGGQKK
jgi:putative ATPase